MQDSAKYLVHADIRASGVVERSDVVGAIFGQTEGLLGEDLDLRDLQESSKVGRIDVQIASKGGRSYGTVTIASGLDRVETAVLAAALETIDRIGPCRAEFEVRELEDARAAKRREVVERATDLLAEFEESTLTSHELVDEVRRNVRVADITEFEGLPAGPRVAESDAVVVVEGRADVLQLLKYGIKNAIAVEGTDVPDAVAALTQDRTVTAFLDGDRGGDLILKELGQVGNVDYVAFAPGGRSVEDLSREEVLSALRKKAPYDHVADASSPRNAVVGDGTTGDDRVDADGGTTVSRQEGDPDDPTDESATPSGGDAGTAAEGDDTTDASPVAATTGTEPADGTGAPADTTGATRAAGADPSAGADGETVGAGREAVTTGRGTTEQGQGGQSVAEPADAGEVEQSSAVPDPDDESGTETPGETGASGAATDAESTTEGPETLAGHVEAVLGRETGLVRLLDSGFGVTDERDVEGAFDAIEDADEPPHAVVLDGELSQRVLDVAAQRSVAQVVARSEGEFVKRPTSVRVRTADEF